MNLRAIIVLVLALIMAAGAVFLARNWIEQQLASRQVAQAPAPALEVTKIVVARTALRFGNRIGLEHVKEMEWPAGSLPPGSFASVDELFKEGKERVVLYAIEPNEPILATKVTGGGERASLSAVIESGMRAVTIRVNDILGVAGFILPGDRVDIMLTREIDKGAPITDVLLQNVKVLGIDQDANEQREEPGVVRAVTLEVSTVQAQKLTLASTVGVLSLSLRHVANVETEPVRRIQMRDLNVGEAIETVEPAPLAIAEQPQPATKTVKRSVTRAPFNPLARVGITRGLVRHEYEVKPERGRAGGPVDLMPSTLVPSEQDPAQSADPTSAAPTETETAPSGDSGQTTGENPAGDRAPVDTGSIPAGTTPDESLATAGKG